MIKPFIFIALAALLAVAGVLAHAEQVSGEVKRIYPAGDKVYFQLKNDTCISSGQYYFFVMNETDATGLYAARNWYSLLLATAVTSKNVFVNVDACAAVGNVEIDYIFVDY